MSESPRTRRWICEGAAALLLAPGGAVAGEGRPYVISFGVKIPTRDGTRLSATIVRPPGVVRPCPVVLTLTPYERDNYYGISTFFAAHGYVGVAVDVRGRGDSEGAFEPFVNDGRDGFDVVEWLAKQQFCDGNVVTRGYSYTGFIQMMVAALRPPSLKTIIPGAAGWPGYAVPSINGIPHPVELQWDALVSGHGRNQALVNDDKYWLALNEELASGKFSYKEFARQAGLPSDYWDKIVAHPVYDEYWRTIEPSREQFAAMEIPVLTIMSAYDPSQKGALHGYETILASSPGQKDRNYLLIGPWDHEGVSHTQTELGGVVFGPAAKVDQRELSLSWFEWVLGRGTKPAYLKDRVTYYVIGENGWRGAPDLNIPYTRVLDLQPTSIGKVGVLGVIDDEKPASDISSFVYDPRKKAVTWGPLFGNFVDKDFLINDPIIELMDGQGLVFETQPLEAAVTLAGRSKLVLNVAISTPDTDLAVMLYEVRRDGHSVSLGYDLIRARYRKGLDHSELLQPGAYEDYHFLMTWMARRIDAGFRLRLVVTSPGISASFLRNRNTGGDPMLETAEDSRICNISIRSAGRSRLYLPLLP